MRRFMAVLLCMGLCALLGLTSTGCGKKKHKDKDGKAEKGKFTMVLVLDEIKEVEPEKEAKGKGKVTITRGEGFDGEVDVVFEGVPEGVKLEAPKIAKDKNEAEVSVTAKVKPDTMKTHSVTAKGKSGDKTAEAKADLKLTKK